MLQNYIRNLENNKKQVSFKMGSDLVGLISASEGVREEMIENASRAYAKLLMFYKDTGFALIKSSIIGAKTKVDDRFRDLRIEMPKVKYMEFSRQFENELNGSQYDVNPFQSTASLPQTLDITTLECGELKEYISTKTQDELTEAYEMLNSVLRNERTIFRFERQEIKNVELAYGIISIIDANDIIPGSLGTVENYNASIKGLKFGLLGIMQRMFKRYVTDIEMGKLVENVNADEITVLKPVADLYFANGGSVEALIGLSITKAHSKKLENILKEKDFLIAKYNEIKSNNEAMKVAKSREVYTTAYVSVIDGLYTNLPEEVPVSYTADALKIELHRYLARLSNVDVMKIKNVVTFIISKLYESTSLGEFISLMEHFKTEVPDATYPTLANLCIMDMLTTMIVDNLDVV